MLNHEKDYLEQRTQFWERFKLYKNKSREEIKEVHRWAAIYNRYKLTQENGKLCLISKMAVVLFVAYLKLT